MLFDAGVLLRDEEPVIIEPGICMSFNYLAEKLLISADLPFPPRIDRACRGLAVPACRLAGQRENSGDQKIRYLMLCLSDLFI